MDVLPSGPGASFENSGGAWQNTLDLTKLANLFALYPSKGDVTIAGATSVTTELDGPIHIVRYGTLTVNAPLTAGNRCRGLVILCDTLIMGAAGSISMTARGAAGCSKWANQSILLPTNLKLGGRGTRYRDFIAWLASKGHAIFDPTLFACPPPGMGDVESNQAAWSGTAIIDVSGCGLGADGGGNTAGKSGGKGTNAPGGGGSGASAGYTACGAPGRAWGGGSASGCAPISWAAQIAGYTPDLWGGPGGNAANSAPNGAGGGGAGNPGGTGCTTGAYTGAVGESGSGGSLIVICRGLLTVASGHSFSSNGSKGGNASIYNSNGGGGGSGGGLVGIWYGSLAGTLSLTATGGVGGTGDYPGGAGGDGAPRSGLLASMGWS